MAGYVYYPGTHDNDTLIGWCAGEAGAAGLSPKEKQGLARRILRKVYLSDAMWVIVPFQDVLGLGSEARMNTPGTALGNWEWRMRGGDLELAGLVSHQEWLRDLAVESGRAHGFAVLPSHHQIVENV